MRRQHPIEAGLGSCVSSLLADTIAIFGTPVFLLIALLGATYEPVEPDCGTRYLRVIVPALIGLVACWVLTTVTLRTFAIATRLIIHGIATIPAAIFFGVFVGFPGTGPLVLALIGTVLVSPATVFPVPESWLAPRAVATIGIVAGLTVVYNLWFFARGWDLCSSNVFN